MATVGSFFPAFLKHGEHFSNQAGVSCVGADFLLIACAAQESKEA